MTKEVAVKKEYAVMDPKQDIIDIIKLNLGGEALSIADLDTIKTPPGGMTKWTLSTAGGDEVIDKFEGIIIHSQIQRTYWKEEYSGKGQPPDCFSNDAINGTGNPGGDCSSCPFDEFGTAKDGKGKGKACSTKRIMFILRENSLLPSVIRVPVGSLKNSRVYLSALSNERQRMCTVRTEFGLVKDQNSGGIDYTQITFKKCGSLSDNEITMVEGYIEKIMPFINQAASVFVPDK
jgi:hypothetical protein